NGGNDFFNDTNPASSNNLNGIAFAQSHVRFADVTDGASNTALATELILSPDTDGHDIRGRYFNPAHSGVIFSTRLPPNTPVPDVMDWCQATPVPEAPCVWQSQFMFVLARSYHHNGVNIAMTDGSTRFIMNQIKPEVYKAMGSRNGNETEPE